MGNAILRNIIFSLLVLLLLFNISVVIFAEENILKENQKSPIHCIPSIFSPDNDQINDYITISLFLQDRDCVTLVIENSQGEIVFELLVNQWLLTGTHQFIWDGRDHNGNILGIGKYQIKLIFPYQNDLTYIKEVQIKNKERFNVNVTKTFDLKYVWIEGNEESFLEKNPGLQPGSSNDQSLQVELEGIILNKFYIYGSFDDQLLDIQLKKDFVFGYMGKKMNLYLGNYNLKPFNNNLISYSQKLWGIRGEQKNNYTFFYGQTEGIQITEEFAGKGIDVCYKLGRMNIVFGSEKVYLNNVLLMRGQDYQIDYYTGEITFTEIISSIDLVKVIYEYYPGLEEQISPRKFLFAEARNEFDALDSNSALIFWHDINVDLEPQSDKKSTSQKQMMFLNKVNYDIKKDFSIKQETGFHLHDISEEELVKGIASLTTLSYHSEQSEVELDLKLVSDNFYFIKQEEDQKTEKEINLRYSNVLPGGIHFKSAINNKLEKDEWQNVIQINGLVKKENSKYSLDISYQNKDDQFSINYNQSHEFDNLFLDFKTKNKWLLLEQQTHYDSFSISSRTHYIPFKNIDLILTTYNYQNQKKNSEERYALKWRYQPITEWILSGDAQIYESYFTNLRKQYLGTVNIKHLHPSGFTSQFKIKGRYKEEIEEIFLDSTISNELETSLLLRKEPYGIQMVYLQLDDTLNEEYKKVKLSLDLPKYKSISFTPAIEYSLFDESLTFSCHGSYIFLDRYKTIFDYSHCWQQEIQKDEFTIGASLKFREYFQIDVSHNLLHFSSKNKPSENYWGGILKFGASAIF